jgi:hypothetical protein
MTKREEYENALNLIQSVGYRAERIISQIHGKAPQYHWYEAEKIEESSDIGNSFLVYLIYEDGWHETSRKETYHIPTDVLFGTEEEIEDYIKSQLNLKEEKRLEQEKKKIEYKEKVRKENEEKELALYKSLQKKFEN